ncbi:MAG: dTDP-4-dehydrorhamnose reductase [Candidatus Eremiobacteraeota bacterium]|nr:dTDP-4-dehydrorhamnose reductase [Candidatus Eremiobacteraeota bacterium]
MKRALLFGGAGQLGTEIRRRWTDWEFTAPSHTEVDIGNDDAVAAAIVRAQPDAVINCAAFHNVDRCEEQPGEAMAVNALAVGRMARRCNEAGTRFVTISTDYVFDGTATRPYTEDDRPRPISAYGVSKYAGELLVEMLESPALIVRTCGVYGVRPSTSKGHTFVDRIVAQGRAREPIRVVDDVVASPTFAGDLAAALEALVASGAAGLCHAANVGPVSWFDFAREVLRQAKIDHPVEPISRLQWKAPARRPAYSALANARLESLGLAMPSWQEGIASYLELAVSWS